MPSFPQREADATRPFDRLSRGAQCNDARPILRHGRLLGKAAPFFLSPCGIVREKSCALKVDRSLRNLERHALEGTHWLSELLALVCIRNCLVECALGEANHLGCDADAT
jgi:hypothetical protein